REFSRWMGLLHRAPRRLPHIVVHAPADPRHELRGAEQPDWRNHFDANVSANARPRLDHRRFLQPARALHRADDHRESRAVPDRAHVTHLGHDDRRRRVTPPRRSRRYPGNGRTLHGAEGVAVLAGLSEGQTRLVVCAPATTVSAMKPAIDPKLLDNSRN